MAKPRRNSQSLQRLQRAGYIVFSDIKDFSIAGSNRQVQLVQTMWALLRKQPMFRQRTAVNVTGDGVVVAFAEEQGKPAASDVFDFALAWDKAVKKAGVAMRLAVHHGTFFVPAIASFPPRLALGSAVNECSRILGFAEPDCLAISEHFVEHWRSTEPESLAAHKSTLSPYPISVWVKHDRPLAIRIRVADKQTTIPRKLSDIEFVKKAIQALLADISRSFLKLLHDYHAGLDETTVGARVSILAPFRAGEGKAVLRSSQFRFSAIRAFIPGDQSQVHYELSGPGMGPPGRAFEQCEVEVLHRLPD